MGPRDESGVWELFVPRLSSGARYCFAVREDGREDASLIVDPFARVIETTPRLAAIVEPVFKHDWRDERFLAIRRARRDCAAPVAIYRIERTPGSAMRAASPTGGRWASACPASCPRLASPTCRSACRKRSGRRGCLRRPCPWRCGRLRVIRGFLSRRGLGVIIEWDAAEAYSDARAAGASVLVENILTDSAMRWIEDFHIDGLSMRTPQRAPNLLARLKHEIDEKAPGVLLMLEDGEPARMRKPSHGAPTRSSPPSTETPTCCSRESAKRLEKSLLPFTPHSLSHFAAASDGDDPLALLRAVYAMAWLTPGMKLMHMGAELGQHTWPDGAVAWDILDDPRSLCFSQARSRPEQHAAQ